MNRYSPVYDKVTQFHLGMGDDFLNTLYLAQTVAQNGIFGLGKLGHFFMNNLDLVGPNRSSKYRILKQILKSLLKRNIRVLLFLDSIQRSSKNSMF